MSSRQQRPYSTLHSPDDGLHPGNHEASHYSLHAEHTSTRSQGTPRSPSPPIGTQPNDIPMKNYTASEQFYTTSEQFPTRSGTPVPGYPSPSVTPAPRYSSPLGSRTASQSPYVPLSTFPPPPTSETHLGPATSPPPTQNLPPIPPAPAHYHPNSAGRPITPKTPVYTPSGASGPNGGVHAPGQIGHPNQQHGREMYRHGIFDCFGDIGTCCTGYWCPCILYSQTKHRLKTSPNSNVNEFKTVNPHCAAFCVLSPVSWVFIMLQRTRIREKYQLQGSIANDCGKAYCCGPCTLVQDEREVIKREDARTRFAGPGSGEVGGYKKSETMVYGRVDL